MSMFSDKRDKDYYKIEIKDHLFEVFKHKTKKCKINIPPTVSLYNGKILNWFFNSKKEQGHPILMRNTDKLTPFEILKFFANMKSINDKTSIEQVIEKHNYDPYFYRACAFVRFNNGEKLIVTGKDLAIILFERINSIQSVQSIVDTQWRQGASSNVLLCEYRMDKDGTPPSYDYVVKSTLTNPNDFFRDYDPINSKIGNRANMEYIYKSHLEDMDGSDNPTFFRDLYGNERDVSVKLRNEAMRSYINKDHKTSYCKSMDARMNSEAGKIARELALYIEGAHKIRVRKLVCLFICDQMHEVYLLGIKELLIDFLTNGVYSVESLRSSFGKGSEVEWNELTSAIHMNENSKKKKESFMQVEHTRKISEIKQEILGIQSSRERMKNSEQESSRKNYKLSQLQDGPMTERIQTFPIPYEQKDKKAFSNVLMSKIQINQCQGDFCEFYTITNSQLFVEDLREVQIDSELRKQREEAGTYQEVIKKPYQILNSLRLKCRDNLEETIELMKQHQIVPKIDNMLVFSDDKDVDERIIDLLKSKIHKKDVENVDNLYRPVRVCKLCYSVYCIMSKHFEKISGLTERGFYSFGEGLKSATSRSALSSRAMGTTARKGVLKDSTMGNVESALPKINSKKASMTDIDFHEGQKSGPQSMTSLPTTRLRKATIDKGIIEDMLEEDLASPKEKVPKIMRKRSEVRINEAKPGKAPLKKSNSQLTNSRLLHGILQKVSSPEVVETERKIMAERELMKLKLKREGSIVHNLLDLVEYKDVKNNKESSKYGSDEQERHIKKASFAYKEASKELEREAIMKQSAVKEKTRFGVAETPTKQVQLSNSELRRRIAEKVALYKAQPNVKLMPHAIDCLYNKSAPSIKSTFDYRLSTSRVQTYYRKLISFDVKSVPLAKFCDAKNMELPNMDITSKVEVLVLNSMTAIPFLVLSSQDEQANTNPAVGSNILVVVHDMFHSFFESISLYEEILSSLSNTKIVVFNYPGQAFTSFDPAHVQTSDDVATVLDMLLNFLSESNRILEQDKMFLIGIGYGGNVASSYLSNINNVSLNIKALLVINSFLRVNQEIEDTIQEWISVLKKLPADIPEIHFNHYYVMALNQEGVQMLKEENFMKDKIEKNPIKIDGKIHILKGLIESLDISDNFKRLDMNVYVVHSLNNCIFRSSNTDQFMQIVEKEETSPRRRFKQEKKSERKVFFYEGGHDIATESPEVLKKFMVDFLANNANIQYKAFSLLKASDYL